MILLRDFQGMEVRLTEERLEHILEHSEMTRRERAIGISVRFGSPLYYWFYRETTVGAKYLCVVVKITQGDAFVLTAYLTDSVKRGWRLWPETE